ncbi:hypothetical protein ACE38W_00715 [Chitinophaga sp. Hz27]|uniref:hypothetical protein n=1 Tax=Chitinophaga sp. Hz27 TaxID=3347169 RepID=UPI0035E0051E
MKSFYNKDYIIEVTEKRFAEYVAAYQLLVKNISTLMIIYSALTISAVPITRDVLQGKHLPVTVFLLFIIFVISFFASILFAISMVFPETDTLLPNPVNYHYFCKKELHQKVIGCEIPLTQEIDAVLLESYITELSYITMDIENIVKRKGKYYLYSFVTGVIGSAAFLLSLFFEQF